MESSDIATSGRGSTAWPALELLGVAADTPMITRDMVAHAKPDPDLFLAAAALLDVEPRGPAGPRRRTRHPRPPARPLTLPLADPANRSPFRFPRMGLVRTPAEPAWNVQGLPS
jgi:hypothetical protein